MKPSPSTLAVTLATLLGLALPALAQRAEGTQARAAARVNTERAVEAAKTARDASKDAKQAAKTAAVTGDAVAAQQAHDASVAAEDAKNDAVEAAQNAEGAGDATERGFAKRDAAAASAEATSTAVRASEAASANAGAARAATQVEVAPVVTTVPASTNASTNATIATQYPGAMADTRHMSGAGRFHIDTNVLDTNHDGMLSRDEARANIALNGQFATIDTNADSSISTDELRSWIAAGGLTRNSLPIGDALSGVGMADAFQMLDADRDGQLTRTEARVDSKLNARFQRLDRNRDGRLSQTEFNAWTSASAGTR